MLISGMDLRGGSFGELRYPRAIMLLTSGRREEVRAELRIADPRSLPYSNDDGPHPFQGSAVAILEPLAASRK